MDLTCHTSEALTVHSVDGIRVIGTTQTNNGDERTVTDPNAIDPSKFYRVQITRP